MKSTIIKKGMVALGLGACLLGAGTAAWAENAGLDTAKIEQLTGLKGKMDAKEPVFKVTLPRKDVAIKVDGQILPPFLGLGTWAAFSQGKDGHTMVMGDNVLFEDEVNPVMDAALANGLEVTALHNHFFYDEPRVFFMHISGVGDQNTLAAAVGKIYDAVKRVRQAHSKPGKSFGGGKVAMPSSLNAADLDAALGTKGQAQDGMYKATFGLETSMDGMESGNAMGVNTWAGFVGNADNAVVDGDFAMHGNEVQAILKALRAGGINIVAIHNHMIGEEPRIIFLHFWGKGKALELAKSVRSALDAQQAFGQAK